ncbi:helix-hairpin-helix domain-containing protein [Leucobacter sp. GX0328]
MKPDIEEIEPRTRGSAALRESASPGAVIWSSEAVLRARAAETDGSGPAAAHRAVSAPIARAEAPGLAAQLKRAVAVPVLAGATVFVVAVAIAIIMATLQMRPGAAAASEVEPALSAATAAGSGADDEPEAAGGAVDSADSEIIVHVIGEVAAPGVVRLPAGSRAADAIESAGGATEAAVLSAVNLARTIVDGEQLLVPNAAQIETGTAVDAPAAAEPAGAAASGSGQGAASVDLNAATAAELETLPRVGPALSQRILEWREANGGFTAVDQLREVSGIGEKTFDGLRELVSVR